MSIRQPRDNWLNAMWESPDLGPAERAIAYAYARYAAEKDTSWVTDEELMRRTGIKSRTTISTNRAKLIKNGWLVEVEKHTQHKSGRFKMKIPNEDKELRTP